MQETLLRAWRGRDSFDGSSLVRAWLYRIATNVCLDLLRRSARRRRRCTPSPRCRGSSPIPDRLLDEVAPSDEQPDAVVVARETIELAFLAALQVLPPRQRAALIARDVLGWPAGRDGGLLETSVAAANSALQRARATHAGAPAGAARGVVGARAERRGTGAARAVHRRARALRRGGRPGDRGAGHPRHDAAVPDAASTGSRRSRRCWSARSARTGTATGASCRRGPTACRRRRATCAGRATPCSGRSSSTCCASRAAPSPRSRRSAPRCSRPSACRLSCAKGPSRRDPSRRIAWRHFQMCPMPSDKIQGELSALARLCRGRHGRRGLLFVPDGVAQDVFYVALGASSVLAIAAGVRRACAQTAIARGPLDDSAGPAALGRRRRGRQLALRRRACRRLSRRSRTRFYLAAYPVLAARAAAAHPRAATPSRHRRAARQRHRSPPGWACCRGSCWPVRPSTLAEQSLAAAAVGLAYPVADILLVGLLIRLVTTPGGRTPAFRLLLAAVLAARSPATRRRPR